MSRFRSKLSPFYSLCQVGGYTWYPTKSGFTSGFVDKSEMTDNLSVGPRRYQPISHKVLHAANIYYSGSLNTTSGTLGASVRTRMAVDVPSTVGDIPWGDMVIQLSDAVRGRLRTKTLLGVSILELAKTVQMVRNPFGLLKHGWRAKVKKLSSHAALKEHADLWLEYKYGWSAFYNDLVNFERSYRKYRKHLADLAQRESDEPFAVRRIVSSAPTALSVGDSEANLLQAVSLPSSKTTDDIYARADVLSSTAVACVSCRATRDALQHYSGFERVMQAAGLDNESLLPTLWEVVPFSFVVDWFVNTGALACRPAMNRLTSVGVSNLGYSVKAVSDWRVRAVFVTPWQSSGFYLYQSPGLLESSARVINYTRTVGLPVGMSVLLGADLSAIQVLSGASLAIQQLYRLRPLFLRGAR